MEKIIKTLILTGLLFQLSACASCPARPEIIPLRNQNEIEPPISLSSEDVRNDLGYLKSFIREAYPGYKLHQSAIDNLDAHFTEIAFSDGVIAPKILCDEISGWLNELKDGHFRTKLVQTPCGNMGTRPGLGVGRNSMEKNGIGVFSKTENRKGKRIAVVAFPQTMLDSKDPRMTLPKDFTNNLMSSDSLIVDLRGNHGGSEEFIVSFVWSLLYGHVVSAGFTSTLMQTKEAFVARINLFTIQDWWHPDISLMNSEGIEQLRASFELAKRGQLPREKKESYAGQSYEFSPMGGFRKPIYVLIDRECSSACEMALPIFAYHPLVKFVGELTAGVNKSGGVGVMALPRSKILVAIPTLSIQSDLNSRNDDSGFKPDVVVPDGSDAMDFTFKFFAEK